MSNTQKPVTPAEEKKAEKTVPTQYQAATDSKIEAILVDVQEKAVDDLQDSLRLVEAKLKHVYGVGVDVRISRSDEGEFTVEVIDPDESKMKRFAGKAKGLFKRNKKLILATGGLIATSVLLKVIANRQATLEADIVEESSDEGIPLGNTGIVVEA